MAFLSPLFLAGALAAALPVVLHFLKREPEQRLAFPAVHLLKHAPVETAGRRRLRELLLHHCKLLLLGLLCGFVGFLVVLDWLKLLMVEDIPAESLRSKDSKQLIPPLHGALLKNEQDVHLFERLAFMARREQRQ